MNSLKTLFEQGGKLTVAKLALIAIMVFTVGVVAIVATSTSDSVKLIIIGAITGTYILCLVAVINSTSLFLQAQLMASPLPCAIIYTMHEREPRPDLEPQELHRLKDELVATWEQLPPEHQATMTLVLIDRVVQGEMGQWLKEAINIKWLDGSPDDVQDNILTNWRRLSRDEQVEVIVEQLRDVMVSEQAKFLRRELGLDDEPPME